MKTVRSLLLAFAALLIGQAAAMAALFQPGEILLGRYGANVTRYSSTGALEQTYTGTGIGWQGASLTPDGNLVASMDSSGAPQIQIFNPAGTQIGSIVAPGNFGPGDVSVFANGTLALTNGNNNTVQLLTQTGTLVNTVNLPGVYTPFGIAIGTDNILYVAGINSHSIAKVSQAGVFLGTIGLGFSPGDLVMNPTDGTLWISGLDTNLVEHIASDGTVLGSFSTGLYGYFHGIGIAPDGASLYVTTEASSIIRHMDLDGNQLGDFAIASQGIPQFLTVVPNPVPEPGSVGVVMAFCLGAVALLGRAPRRRRS